MARVMAAIWLLGLPQQSGSMYFFYVEHLDIQYTFLFVYIYASLFCVACSPLSL
jgi:hypothetical protein